MLRGHRGPVSCVAMSRDGKHAVSSSWDTTLKYLGKVGFRVEGLGFRV